MSVGVPPRRRGSFARTTLTGVVAVGFFALAFAAWAARESPPTGYELSIYAGTPPTVWVGVGVALAGALIAALVAPSRAVRGAALALGGTAITVVTLLPLLRNYRFQGAGDSLTHLGWTREMLAGTLEPIQLFYPAVHVVALQLHAVTPLSVERSLMLTVVVFIVAFLLFVPLVVRVMTRDSLAVTVAAVSAWFLLPVNHVGTVLVTYPTTQALFFLPVVLFALLLFLRRSDGVDRLPGGVSPYAVVLAFAGVVVVLVHPQQAANVLVLFGSIVLLQFALRRWRPASAVSSHRPLYAQTAFLAAFFIAWTVRREKFRGALNATLTDLFVPGLESASEIGQRSLSLSDIGIGIEVLFVRLFLVGAVYAVLSGWLTVAAVRRTRLQSSELGTAVIYFAVGLFPLTALFGFYFATTPTLGFRQVGLLLVFGTILGAVAIAVLVDRFEARLPAVPVRSALGVCLAVAVVLSVITVFPSPFIYKSSNHITDQQWEGHEFALEHRGDGMHYSRLTLAAKMYRYGDAILGVSRSGEIDYGGPADARVPPDSFNDGAVSRTYDDPRYVKISRADYERAVVMYDEFRYRQVGFERLSSDRGLDKVATNGVFRLYVTDGAS